MTVICLQVVDTAQERVDYWIGGMKVTMKYLPLPTRTKHLPLCQFADLSPPNLWPKPKNVHPNLSSKKCRHLQIPQMSSNHQGAEGGSFSRLVQLDGGVFTSMLCHHLWSNPPPAWRPFFLEGKWGLMFSPTWRCSKKIVSWSCFKYIYIPTVN